MQLTLSIKLVILVVKATLEILAHKEILDLLVVKVSRVLQVNLQP